MILEDRLNKWMKSYDQNGYLHGSILVASGEDILVNKGFGMANWEHKVPNTHKTKFRIGSITKGFTAMGIFLLHEKKKLDINDCIAKYLPNYPHGDKITIYHCLTNTSGISNYSSSPDFWIRTMRLPSTLQQLIDSFKDLELEFEPGSRFGYSNSGYALLTAIIETVSGMSYAEYIKEQICQPLGMLNTGCDDGIRVVPDLATGYSFWEEPIHAAYADLSFPLGSHGLYSSTEDLFIWGKAITSSKLINETLKEKMLTPNLNSYACGWAVSELLGKRSISHFGDISGYSNDLLRFINEEVTVIFLSNLNVTPVTHLCEEMAKILLGERVTLPLPAEPIEITKMDVITGKYQIENQNNRVLEVSIKNNEFYITIPKMYGALYKFKLIPVAHSPKNTTFLTERIHEQFIFHYSATGQIHQIVYVDYLGNQHTLHKVD